MNGKFFLFLMLPFLFLAESCDRTELDPKGDEMARLEAWIRINNIIPDSITPSGMYILNSQEGTGESPVDSNYVLYSYVMRNLDDEVYLTTYKDTAKLYDLYSNATHYVPGYIYYNRRNKPKGVTEALGMMKVGGKARYIVPSSLGYGKSGYSTVTSYTTLIYDIELNGVITDPEAYEQSRIDEYLAAHPGFTNISDSIYYKKVTDGTVAGGVANDSIVSVNYTGRFLDGFVFETKFRSVAIENGIYSSSSSYIPMEFTIGNYNSDKSPLPSFHLAVKQMIQGEKAIFVIPSKYMYGVSGSSGAGIQPYEPLIFEIELVDVVGKISSSTTTK